MTFKTKGLILKEQSVGERDKLITVLTEERGTLRAFVRGGKAVKSKKGAVTGKFCYAALTLTETKDSFVVDEAAPIELFFKLRESIDKLALAEYFLELGFAFSPEAENAKDNLKVILNSLYFLCNDTYKPKQLKAITELRLLTLAGYAPNLVACEHCGAFETGTMYFDMQEGLLYCENCAPATAPFCLPLGIVNAMRHIVFSENKGLYAFQMDEGLLDELSYITETYLLRKTERKFKTLDFYNSVQAIG